MGVKTCLADACCYVVIDVRCSCWHQAILEQRLGVSHPLIIQCLYPKKPELNFSESSERHVSEYLRVIGAAWLKIAAMVSNTSNVDFYVYQWFWVGCRCNYDVYSFVTLEAARPTTAWKTQCLLQSSWKMPTSALFMSSASTGMVIK